ncbi:MAG: pyrogallol hydroxytransferase large subunit [Betaproteobacteria bacterium RIFCSPLOWO2_12_FULL_62_58]|nr:MAG: pyrogallol hydroxytransferase large subunit [Betaproteobacteria bacterium RIFCSPLOWO2_12_FULL_62_58]
MVNELKLSVLLFGVAQAIRFVAWKHASFREHLKKRNGIVQIKTKDNSLGRIFQFTDGRVSSRRGIHPGPDAAVIFKDAATAVSFMSLPVNHAARIHAAKNFLVAVEGPDELVSWFMQLLNMILTAGIEFGARMADGAKRYTTMTNGGPLFVYVKAGRIVRTNVIEYDDKDAPSWTIEARGRKFTPRRKAMVAPHALALRSLVYSDQRLLYPMKRVDFDPNGKRNCQNRGASGYERISWDEALDIVSGEILRMKRQHGPGAIAIYHSSHHQWGNVGYYLSALQRFGNAIGYTKIHLNPDSWEGWYWGATHHFGNSMRLGRSGSYGTLVDCLRECEMIVFWSSDPESQFGGYGGQEGAQRRLWAQELGIKMVHINPYYCPTASLLGGKWFPIRPGTDSALAIAIMHVWITEGLYDKDYVATRTTGFEEWRDYVLGTSDGVAKTPEWQETETGIPARDVRALAREWAARKTYLSTGSGGTAHGGACRTATGAQWARSMILLMAMRGWGKPGINLGCLQGGAPVDLSFYFPGYAEGGISGDVTGTAAAVNNYVRMPHLLTMNPVQQMIPRQRLPEAILDGHCEGYPTDSVSVEGQFRRFQYPTPGLSKVHMLYRYGGSSFGTIADSSRFADMYRSDELEFVVNQSIWLEGEAKFADIILPACTQLERWDIGEWSNTAGYAHHQQGQLSHRVIAIQHKCIEPLGESKSDYQIFWDITKRLGLGTYYSEGMTEFDWCKRVFDSSDLPRHISWKAFLRKGYYVVPAENEKTRGPVNMRWFAEDRLKDVPEPHPLPGGYSGKFRTGLQTQSGKIEFIPETLKRFDPDSPDRPPLNRYIPSWEGPRAEALYRKFPLQLVTGHARYSYHTVTDSKNSVINDIQDHRVLIDGHYYWIVRINADDARQRGIRMHDIVKVYNDRAAVLCAADVMEAMAPGVVHSCESCASYDPLGEPGKLIDRGGCMNLLTPSRKQVAKSDGMAAMSCLVQIETWKQAAEAA